MTALERGRRLRETLDAARRVVEDGAVIDLAGMEAEVAGVCSELLARSAEQRGAATAELAALSAALDRLAAALGDRQEAAAEAVRQRASRAYESRRPEGHTND